MLVFNVQEHLNPHAVRSDFCPATDAIDNGFWHMTKASDMVYMARILMNLEQRDSELPNAPPQPRAD